jgi:DNA-binding response OmpR family regulator
MTKKKILVVDDETGITNMLKRNLEATGLYEARTENSSVAALSTAREFLPDLIVMDVMMPGMDGGEVATRIREDRRLSCVPIVFLSALVKKEETQPSGSEIGGETFLAKPVTLDDLIACVEQRLGK